MKLSAKWTVLTRQKHLNVTGMEVSTISQRIYSLLVREALGKYESEASSDKSEVHIANRRITETVAKAVESLTTYSSEKGSPS